MNLQSTDEFNLQQALAPSVSVASGEETMLNPAQYPYLADLLAQPEALDATAAALARQQVPAFLRQSIE